MRTDGFKRMSALGGALQDLNRYIRFALLPGKVGCVTPEVSRQQSADTLAIWFQQDAKGAAADMAGVVKAGVAGSGNAVAGDGAVAAAGGAVKEAVAAVVQLEPKAAVAEIAEAPIAGSTARRQEGEGGAGGIKENLSESFKVRQERSWAIDDFCKVRQHPIILSARGLVSPGLHRCIWISWGGFHGPFFPCACSLGIFYIATSSSRS